MTLVSRLARRHQTPTLFACAIYDKAAGRHRIHCFEGEPAVADTSPEAAAAALNRGVERCVRQFPEHYQWAYRRFEIPDSDQPSPYSRKRS
jgi:KDO2-lipid IV(A) lauroyltransferase